MKGGAKVVQGYVGIAELLQSIWNISVSPKTAWKYANQTIDPLPVSAANGRIWAFEEKVRLWASKRIGQRRINRH